MRMFSLGLLFFSSLAGASPENLVLNFKGLRSGEGYLAVSIFAEAERSAYPGKAEKATKTLYIALEGRTEVSASVSELPTGRYAVAVMHDEDGNKELKTGLFGIPREGFGFSNNPTVYFGAPSFDKVSFDTGQKDSIDVNIKYF